MIIRLTSAEEFLNALHGEGPWYQPESLQNQTATCAFGPLSLAFVHRPRGLWPQTQMTCICLDFRDRPPPPVFAAPPSALLTSERLITAFWILQEPVYADERYYRCLDAWARTHEAPPDRVGALRLVSLPGNERFPSKITLGQQRYSLDDL